MSYIIISKPGSGNYSPCVNDCQHKDCNEQKSRAATLCPFCVEPLGYDRPLTTDEGNSHSAGLAHFSCIEKHYENEQKQTEV